MDFQKINLRGVRKEDTAKIQQTSVRDIAVIGMAARMPMAADAEEFWRNIAAGLDCIDDFPQTRREDTDIYLQNAPAAWTAPPSYARGAYLPEIDKFDPAFFQLSPREAALISPNQRMFLETAWEAMEDAGYGGRKLAGSRTGVYLGFEADAPYDYKKFIAALEPDALSEAVPGNLTPIIASRLSYLLDLRGPSMSIDTACSSALVAVHTACQAIRNGECEMALAGSVRINFLPLKGQLNFGIDSSDGKTRAFDDRSDGTGSGEGVAAVFLKPLAQALKDNDHIHAVIKGGAVNQDGRSIGITAPNVLAQEDVIVSAWKDAEVDPETIAYIEAHGTGTKLGDPIEIDGILRAFQRYTARKQFCAIGSVKTNIGHLDNAAGIAGLIKAVQSLRYKKIPPTLHFQLPNRQIRFENSPVYVNDRLRDWETEGAPRRCGVSSFGFSGTNCHLVLEEAPPQKKKTGCNPDRYHILALSAKSAAVLSQLVRNYRKYLNTDRGYTPADICGTAGTGRGHYNHRLALLVKDMEDLQAKLHYLSQSPEIVSAEGIFYGEHKIIPLLKKHRETNEVTDADIKELTRQAKEKTVSYAASALRNRDDAAALCALYVKGAGIDWDEIYAVSDFQKVPLPGYPFERKRCWVQGGARHSAVNNMTAGKSLSLPLLDSCLAESLDQEIYVTNISPATHWVVNEHRVDGQFMMVGTAYLEMALEAAKKYFPDGRAEIRDLVMLKPLILAEGESRPVQTVLKKVNDHHEFSIISKAVTAENPSGNWIMHAAGKVFPPAGTLPPGCDLAAIKQKCPRKIIHPGVDGRNAPHIQFGPRWNNIQALYRGEGQTLSHIKMGADFHPELSAYILYPALLDNALAVDAAGEGREYLPFSYRQVKVFGPLPAEFYSYVTVKEGQNTGGEILVFDITIMHPSGEVAIAIENFTLKKSHIPPKGDAIFYETAWVPREIEATRDLPPGTVLIFTDPSGLGDGMARKLKGEGREVITVELGRNYQEGDGNRFIITGSQADYDRLCAVIKKHPPAYIIHLFAVTGENEITHVELLDKTQTAGVYSLFYFIKSLLRNNFDNPMEIILAGSLVNEISRTEPHMHPEYAPLFGLGKVVTQEHAHIKCRSVDLDMQTTAEDLLRELKAVNASYQVGYRDGNRYVEEFRRTDLEKLPERPVEIKSRGVYVITGGAGGIGLEIGKYLAAQNKVNLALINRSPLPAREHWETIMTGGSDAKLAHKIRAIREIEEGGSEVACLQADVSLEEDLRSALDNLRKKYGGINGIIHSAGIAGAGFIMHKDAQTFGQVLAPKVRGTWLLDKLTARDEMDFLILFSSVTTLAGAPGQSDYTAANAYLDSYTAYRNKKGKRTFAINWAGWQETGMAADYGVNFDGVFKVLPTKKAIDAFHRVLRKDLKRVHIGEFNHWHETVSRLVAASFVKLSAEMQHEAALDHAESVSGRVSQPQQLPLKLKGNQDNRYSEMEKQLGRVYGEILGLSEIDIYDDFNELGGDSLIAMRMLTHINQQLNMDLDITTFFRYPSIKELAGYLEKTGADEKDAAAVYAAIPKLPEPENYRETVQRHPVSSAQKRLYILNTLEGIGTSYNLPRVMLVNGELDVGRLENVFQIMVGRHESLRTSFEMMDGEPVQAIHPRIDFTVDYREACEKDTDILIKEFIRRFDLSKPPLFRVGLVKLAPARFLLMFDIHHIILDAISMNIFIKEFIALYQEQTLPELRIQYKDFAAWQNNLFASGALAGQEEFWLKTFDGSVPVLDLPTDYPRPATQSFAGARFGFRLDEKLTAALNRLAAETGSTVFMVLLSLFNILLAKYSGQEDIVIGSPVSGRSNADLENLIGMFVNTLPMRNYPEGSRKFRDFLIEVKQNTLQVFANQDYQFEVLVEKLNLRRDLSRNPLFDVMFVYYNIGNPQITIDGIPLIPYELDFELAKFDLTLVAEERGDALKLDFEYCAELFKKDTMARMAEHFRNIAGQVLDNPEIRLSDIDMLSAEEKRRILIDFNNAGADYPRDKTIHELFEEQAEKTPDNIAVMFGNTEITYGELNQKANRVARLLRKQGIKPDGIVGLMAERSLEMIIGMIGILKAGGAYLPIDPEFPEERIKYMAEDSGLNVLLTQSRLAGKAGLPGDKIYLLDEEEIFRKNSAKNPAKTNKPGDLAYVMYTSGSTGKPKGVMVEHRQANNCIHWMQGQFPLTGKDIVVQRTNLTFDPSVWEIFWPLSRGACIKLLTLEQSRDAGFLIDLMADNTGLTVMYCPASLITEMTYLLKDRPVQPSLRLPWLIIGAEPVARDVIREFHAHFQGIIVNTYGPTECAINNTYYYLEREDPRPFVPIGRPVANNQVYILDKYRQPLPVNVPGEIYIAGESVARGYVRNPEKTSAGFKDNPFGPGRIYQTGDIGRWLDDGNIEIMGRTDHQAKIRGYRIEPGEIESVLLKHDAVSEAVVAAREGSGSEKYLCAYLILNEEIGAPELRAYLAKSLPDYMIPSYFVKLEKIPLTPNGKIDRKALPEPDKTIHTDAAYEPPGDAVEKALADIWQQLLGLERVGVYDDFFEIGGHSLKAANLAARIHKEFRVAIPLREVFLTPTVRGLAAYLRNATAEAHHEIKPLRVSEDNTYAAYPPGCFPTSSAQRRMFIVNQLEGDGITYNLPATLIVKGRLDLARFIEAFQTLIERHETLRTSFRVIDGEPVQEIHEKVDFRLGYRISDREKAEDIITGFIRPFDLGKAPLLRAELVKIGDDEHLLLFDMHHIISDGISLNILSAEFAALYEGKALTAPKVRYKDFAVWQNELFQTEYVRQQEKYWREVFSGEPAVLNMPYDFPRPPVQTFDGDRIYFQIDRTLTDGLNKLAKETRSTLYMVLFAAYNILLSKYTGQEEIIVGSPAAGRPHSDLESIVGMFVNTVVMRNFPQSVKTCRAFLEEVKTNALQAFENQDYQFEMLVDGLDLPKDLSRNPLFDTFFAFQSINLSELTAAGDLQFSPYEYRTKISKFDFMLFTYEKDWGVLFDLEYNINLFKRETMERFADHFVNIIREMIAGPDAAISRINMLSEAERKQILVDFNSTSRNYPFNGAIHHLIEAQAARTPDNIAVIFNDERLTYRELNRKANLLAGFLRAKGVTSETVVGLMLDKSCEMVISLLAILKAGGAYLPIDPGYPQERILHLLDDSKTRFLITGKACAEKLPFTTLQNIAANQRPVVLTGPRKPLQNFNALPIPDRTLIDMTRYKNKIGMASVNHCISLQTTRGCPYQCIFCHKVWSKTHVWRDAENIFQEIEQYYRKGVMNFAIIDDCFNLNMENGKRLFQKIIDRKVKVRLFFPNGLRGDLLTPDYIDLMAAAGVANINLSLETAAPRLQKLIKKNLDLERFRSVVDYIASRHPQIILELATMHGFPSETEEEALQTLKFIQDTHWIHFPYIHILKVYPNTEMEDLALAHGVAREDILKSVSLAFHDIPETLPFPKSFTRKYQAEFLNGYFLSRERLSQVLPIQMKILGEAALVEKYRTYLPMEIKSIADILQAADLTDLPVPGKEPEPEIPAVFTAKPPARKNINPEAKRILLLDLSQYFSSHRMLYKVVEQPLGLLYLLTTLKEHFGDAIDGKIYKSGVDFDSFHELRELATRFEPHLIGIRALSFNKEFFHETISLLRQWGFTAPIITGGPYATSDYRYILQDKHVDLVVLGEGEETFREVIGRMMENGFALPETAVLKNIPGIAFAESLSAEGDSRSIILLDEGFDFDGDDPDNPEPAGAEASLAYVMYTSGSTGKPKGVMVEHRQVNNCIGWMQERFPLTAGDMVVQRTNLTFDPSVWEIFWPLYQGAGIKLLTAEQGRDAGYLIDLMAGSHELTVMYCPASLLTGMTYLLDARPVKPLLRLPWLLIGAEPVARDVINRFYSYFLGKIVNTYGPTECVINNTYYDLDREDQHPVVPIGKPVANNQIYILDKDRQLVPLNVPGEIYIAGKSVARGYIHNPEKTGANFLENPFGPGKIYRTGDIGRWLDDGNIEIMGRTDQQVKIRGYRIEPGEIEAVLVKHEAVRECVVVAKDSKASGEVKICPKCGITSRYPDVVFNQDGDCNYCCDFSRYQKPLADYFKVIGDLELLLRKLNHNQEGRYDCLLLYAGGRGSAYALYQLADMGFKVLAATYDNGYFSKRDLDNIKFITERAGVDHVRLTHPNSEAILRESMQTASTVCKGCFFTSSSLAVDYALRHKIKVVIGATLSRGQIIENKLLKFLKQGVEDAGALEKEVSNLQKLTYDMNTNLYELIDIDAVKDGTVYDRIKTVDFYRYCDITNENMINYLNGRDAYWKDRKNYAVYSTNCPIKQLGDYCHLQDRGYHYYGHATSWEKRLGHISLANIREDLQCKVTPQGYEIFLKKLGVPKAASARKMLTKYLCAYLVSEKELPVSELRGFLSRELPDYMIPSYFIDLPKLPVTPEGKIDRKALPEPDFSMSAAVDYVAPQNEYEEKMAAVWQEALGVERVGTRDNFFDLGGDSIKAIQVSSLLQNYKHPLAIKDLFQHPTIGELSSLLPQTEGYVPEDLHAAEDKTGAALYEKPVDYGTHPHYQSINPFLDDYLVTQQRHMLYFKKDKSERDSSIIGEAEAVFENYSLDKYKEEFGVGSPFSPMKSLFYEIWALNAAIICDILSNQGRASEAMEFLGHLYKDCLAAGLSRDKDFMLYRLDFYALSVMSPYIDAPFLHATGRQNLDHIILGLGGDCHMVEVMEEVWKHFPRQTRTNMFLTDGAPGFFNGYSSLLQIDCVFSLDIAPFIYAKGVDTRENLKKTMRDSVAWLRMKNPRLSMFLTHMFFGMESMMRLTGTPKEICLDAYTDFSDELAEIFVTAPNARLLNFQKDICPLVYDHSVFRDPEPVAQIHFKFEYYEKIARWVLKTMKEFKIE
ncbi:MAG: amino acid adenylation domain-containing protein [Bacillota bacterium]